jgi:hypothetical protein
MHAPINATFVALIPKSDEPKSMDNFRLVSLCNCIYKVVSKVIARRIKSILSDKLSREQFGFLEGKQIHKAIEVAREVMHHVKMRKVEGAILKIDLSKACGLISWLYIGMLLTHLGFKVPFINWVMCCLTTVSFAVLINGSASPFFHVEQGLRQ